MNIAWTFSRIFFGILTIFFFMVYILSLPELAYTHKLLIGLGLGVGYFLILYLVDLAFRKFNLRSFNITLVGLGIGILMGKTLSWMFQTTLTFPVITSYFSSEVLDLIQLTLFLFGAYLGIMITLRSSDELHISIPFVKFSHIAQKKKDLLVDASVLSDPRIIDLCNTGIFDHQIVIPRFIIKELYAQTEMNNEITKQKAKKALEVIQKMEEHEELGLRYQDTDFPELKDTNSKLIRLARLVDGNILSSDINRVQMAAIEGIKVINLHSLSNALKPLMETGESIRIKVQRYGKEERQGVGYLDDGTMVVINGGGDYIGEIIDANVLSVKHTSSGRMIFCNAVEDEIPLQTQHSFHPAHE